MAYKQKLTFGIIVGTRSYFNSALAADVRATVLKEIKAQGYDCVILGESETPTGSIETYDDAKKCAALFRANRDKIDGIIVSLPNFGYEVGIVNSISLSELNVPVLVQACDDENDKVTLDKRRDAFCGKLSVCNNLYQYNIPFTDTSLHTYSIHSEDFKKDLIKFAGVCRVVNGLRKARVGVIGCRPIGFQTCRASEKLLQATGITVVPVDLSEILSAANKIDKEAAGMKARIEQMKAYANIPKALEEKLLLQAQFGQAVDEWIAENEIDASAIQCWDSMEKNYGCAPCLTMSMMSDRLFPSACEADIAGAVSMYTLMQAAGTPPALADWNNNFAENRNKCVCTHCGNFAKGFTQAPMEVGSLGVLGNVLGRVNTVGAVLSKVSEGPFTYFRISTDDNLGLIKSYLGEGKITNDPYGMDGCIAVTEVENLQGLMKYMCKNGFEHHVGLVRGQVADIIEEAIGSYLDWDIYRHS
jgi:L-fucose isomerase-like protein